MSRTLGCECLQAWVQAWVQGKKIAHLAPAKEIVAVAAE
jgi:hypothetical protein